MKEDVNGMNTISSVLITYLINNKVYNQEKIMGRNGAKFHLQQYLQIPHGLTIQKIKHTPQAFSSYPQEIKIYLQKQPSQNVKVIFKEQYTHKIIQKRQLQLQGNHPLNIVQYTPAHYQLTNVRYNHAYGVIIALVKPSYHHLVSSKLFNLLQQKQRQNQLSHVTAKKAFRIVNNVLLDLEHNVNQLK